MDNYQPYFDLGELIAKHLRDELSDQQKKELEHWLQLDTHNQELFHKLIDDSFISYELENYPASEKDTAWENIAAQTGFKNEKKKPARIKQLLPYAAAILLLATIGITVSKSLLKKSVLNKPLAMHQPDLLPGGNKAILTLANGSKIVLNEALRGVIARQQNVAINQIQNGKIVYSAKGAPIDSLLVYNTIATPRGGQYQVVLPDGTKVWLNAASSLKYPTAFYGNERRVELTGEAYFEVSKNAAKPFFVKTAAQTVEVLGTHFNINSYADEKATKTTLLEGSVKVYSSANQLSVKLVPGQQALNILNQLQVIRDADVDEAVAWKNGKFMFRNTDLQTIMRQLSRWYDVDVEYQGNVTARHYIGSINRNVPVSQVFQILKTSGINFTIYGRKIIVKS